MNRMAAHRRAATGLVEFIKKIENKFETRCHEELRRHE